MINISILLKEVINTKEAKKNFTKINKLAAKEGMVVITKRSEPATALISMETLRKILGENGFKELLYDIYLSQKLGKEVNIVLKSKEKAVPFKDVKEELGW